LTDRPAEASSNGRWQPEADEPWDDRPGIVASLLRYRLLVVAGLLAGALVGFGFAQVLPVLYEADAGLILSDPGGPAILGGSGSSLASSDRQIYLAKQAGIMGSSVVLHRALRDLESQESVSDVRKRLTIQPSKDLASISVTATGDDADSAAALANAVGTAYEAVTAERAAQDARRAVASLEKIRARLQDELDASPRTPDGRPTSRQQRLAGRIADLEQREEDITLQVAVSASGVELFERAEPPTAPAQPKPKLYAALGALLGLLGAGALAWWAAARYRRAEGRADPVRILGAPLLGEVPELRAQALFAPEQPVPPGIAEAYHFVVASLDHELAGLGGSSVVVTSVSPSESKTSTTLQLASAAVAEDRRILMIDADERTQRLSQLCGAYKRRPREHNGHEATSRTDEAKEYVHRLVVTRSGMVLPIRPNGSSDHHAAPVHAPRVRQALQSVGEMFDLVLIDAPALLAASDTMSVAGQADGVVLVVNHGVLLSRLRDVRDRLAFVNTPLIGYVYVRPRSNGVRSLWGRIWLPLGSSLAVRRFPTRRS
jgi:Mrp family chromosome partitioning ATPase